MVASFCVPLVQPYTCGRHHHDHNNEHGSFSSTVYQPVLSSSSRLLHLFDRRRAGRGLSPFALQCDRQNNHIGVWDGYSILSASLTVMTVFYQFAIKGHFHNMLADLKRKLAMFLLLVWKTLRVRCADLLSWG